MRIALMRGPWRAVPVLGIGQILAWGTMFFPVVLVVPVAAAERRWAPTFVMAGFSTALLIAGLASPRVGRLVDRYGGHRVIPVGSLFAGAGLAALPFATHIAAWFACWCVIGIAMASTLYEVAFATLGRLFGTSARRPITWLALVSGLASTFSWPLSHALMQSVGWHAMYWIYAAVMVLINAPLAALALPRGHYLERAASDATTASDAAPVRTVEYLPATGWPFLLVAAGGACWAFYHGAYSAHLIAMVSRMGLDAGTVVVLASLSGPSQVLIRTVEIVFGRGAVHPLWMLRGAVALLVVALGMIVLLGVSTVTVGAFFILYGVANGIFTIARGALPLSLFGPAGYGHVMGRIALPFLVMQALAPIVVGLVIERLSDQAGLVLLWGFAVLSLACYAFLRRP